jgi:ABC-2 type transport system permease protein
MNTQSNAIPESSAVSQVSAIVDISPARRMYWSIQRELWENRSIYLVPLVVMALILLSSLIGTIHLPAKLHAAALGHMQQQDEIARPYVFAALLLMGVTLVVAIFYCLDALQGERRDRSILFWKSLPVSDLTTVLAKASIPIVILPLITFAVTAATQAIMLLLSTARLLGTGDVAMLWSHVPLFHMWAMLFFHLLALHGFWYAPFYAWMLLASAWARRLSVLWAVLPLFAIAMLEKIAFNTLHFAHLLRNHFMGDPGAPSPPGHSTDLLTPLTPSQLLTSPGLWIGLAITAALLAAAVQLRRYREPN